MMLPQTINIASKALILAGILLLPTALHAQESILGTWLTGEDNDKVEIAQSGDDVTGKLIASDNPKATIGMEILTGLKLDDGKWTGKLYAPRKHKTFDATFVRTGSTLSIDVSAGMMSKKLTWNQATN